jgi:hypothetical protein
MFWILQEIGALAANLDLMRELEQGPNVKPPERLSPPHWPHADIQAWRTPTRVRRTAMKSLSHARLQGNPIHNGSVVCRVSANIRTGPDDPAQPVA